MPLKNATEPHKSGCGGYRNDRNSYGASSERIIDGGSIDVIGDELKPEADDTGRLLV
jgi:hypothetical protein